MDYNKERAIHPGEILREQFLVPRKISQAELARGMKVSVKRINEICQGRRGITLDTAYRLEIYLNLGKGGTESWMNLQHNYEKRCWKNYWENEARLVKKQIQPRKEEKAYL
ncbi:MAG: HigA family addiction module antidote protein [Candidatus Moeniiplasma glomeromycotorum]|nr:HigA family addiction module antidote protein [Candidatus Moeniiplasma glomeromycotorum]MCE8167016.1 HigA family addiction module antidote protein [Candidatus Moeniiplasma glomeromycotorum]MCE8168972.1 HigA family addiction module antidote protein [Candidatus Moeniiplasma glomeromycotorum]